MTSAPRSSPDSGPRDHLTTEARNPAAAGLDALPTAAAFDVLNSEDAGVARAVAAAKGEIVAAVDRIAEQLAAGGRLFYVGAGTSGRLGVLDAAECPPTFRSDPALVQALIAGGPGALVRSSEGAEDDAIAAGAALAELELGPCDVVLGVTAGGTTPYVHGALAFARERGAATVFFACVDRSQASDSADLSIRVVTGPEVLAGSTRMKAGTATKLVLNTISTLVMVRLGKTYDNLMVDLNAGANTKLWQRATTMTAQLTGLDRASAAALLERAEGSVKRAAVMHAHSLDAGSANERLAACGGHLRAALAHD